MVLRIAIIGRPNVGKSTLFNRLVGRKVAIVHDKPGVTRDRREAPAKLYNLRLSVIDTAGYEYSKEDSLEKRMWLQTERAIAEADATVFLFDARDGIQPYDEHLAGLVRHSGKPVILLANKCEGKLQEDSIHEAYKLGLGTPIPFSAEHGLGLADLYEALKPEADKLKETAQEAAETDENASAREAETDENTDKKRPIQLAIVGRPNVGKSTLVNALLNDERMLTGPEAGVTRDAIASEWTYEGRKINLVDTAGLRKRARIEDSLEKMAAASTKKAAYLAQVVVLVLDADAVLDKQDLTIAREVLEEGRALVIAVNKWDIANRKEALQKLNDKLQTSLTQAEGIPTVTISALKKENLDKLMRAVLKVYDRWNLRIPTAPLNQWFADMIDKYPPPLGKNKRRIKLRYITQAKTRPPSFYIFSSNPEGLPDAYLRYLTNHLREDFDLRGIPLRITVRKTGNPYAGAKEKKESPIRNKKASR
ncbi:MAG: ribosome biogenesis GTPase Der [Alphaproteobacteria bacterium]|nr:ribosome biogenesis GTPase Der [Alphaproteobacteria bacterium]